MSAVAENKRSNRKAKKKRSAQQLKENHVPEADTTCSVRDFIVKWLLTCVGSMNIFIKGSVLFIWCMKNGWHFRV